MKFFSKGKDGGPDSNVTGYFLIEIKPVFSIVILRFEGRSRTNYHTHAFNALTWLISGTMTEIFPDSIWPKLYTRSLLPKITKRNQMHKVNSHGVSWALSIRGPWKKTWKEYDPVNSKFITLTHGRKIID
jgi:hypothetical protein